MNNLKQKAGDLMRCGAGLGVVGTAMKWYNGVKDYVLNEVIHNIGMDLTRAIQYPFCAYGIGEAINAYQEYRNRREESETFPQYMRRLVREAPLEVAGTIMTLAPVASPIISSATGNDFFKSILIPAGVCVAGHTIKYLCRGINNRKIREMMRELYSGE